MTSTQKIAGVQMHVALADVTANRRRMIEHLEQLAAQDVRLAVFPECALTGYCFESLEEASAVAESIPGPSTAAIAEACARLTLWAVFGMLEADGDRIFNACVLVGPEGVVGSHRKIHIPFLGIDRFTTPGDRPFAVHQAGEIRIGMNICYDGSFPESARILALMGADLIVLPTNWPPGAECTAAHMAATRAMENHVYYMAVNRVGTERGFRFIGNSKICSPHGHLLAEAADEEERVFIAEIDVEQARNKHLIRVPGKHEIDRFKDRRPEMYGPIVQQATGSRRQASRKKVEA